MSLTSLKGRLIADPDASRNLPLTRRSAGLLPVSCYSCTHLLSQVTPAFAMLQDLIARRRAVAAATGGALPPAGRVSLIWISRSRDELGTLPADILLEATRCVSNTSYAVRGITSSVTLGR